MVYLNILYGLIFVCIVSIFLEYIFRQYSKKKHGKIYKPIGKSKISDYTDKYKSYPYLPYLLKKRKETSRSKTKDLRPFAQRDTYIKEFPVNDFGVYDVCNPDNVVRDYKKKLVLLIGSSVLEGIIWVNDKSVQVSSVLQEKLDIAYPEKYQVISVAQAGWLSSEIMVYYLMRLISLKPDIVLYYHGANDVLASMSDNFQSDYSHYRRPMAEVKNKIYLKLMLSSCFPYVKSFTLYEFLLRKAGLRFHPLYELSKLLRPNQPNPANIDKLEANLEVEKENIKNIIACTEKVNCRVFLMSYVFWQYDSKSKWQEIQKRGVEIENNNLKEISEKQGVEFLDFANMYDFNENLLIDEQHFNRYGIDKFTDVVMKKISEIE